jgi:methionyl aminopeptidase
LETFFSPDSLRRGSGRHVNRDGITIHTPEDFEGMRRAGRFAAGVLDMIADHVAPGVGTGELDALVQAHVERGGAQSATIGYKGYRHATCISVNHVVCHGIPGAPIPKGAEETVSKDLEKRRANDRLLDGDILNIDVTVIVDGWYGDNSRMYVAGRPKPYAARLIQITHDALMKGIEAVRPGQTFGDIGHAIQSHAESKGVSVVREFCGHGLGRVFHAAPNVLHYGRPGSGPRFEEGMFFTIEPMINLGRPETRTLADDWTAVTRDRSLSAQFEHSVGVTADGCEIFTLSPAGRFHPTQPALGTAPGGG